MASTTKTKAITNSEIAQVLNNIGDLLELKGEMIFKVRAYQKAARSIEYYPQELAQLYDQQGEEGLDDVPNVGSAITKKVGELLTTGSLQYFEKLKAQFPEGVINLMDVPGVGPKTALKISEELGVANVEDLEKALKSGQVAALPGMGEKAATNILRHLQTLRTKDRRIPLGQALSAAEEIIGALRSNCPGVHKLETAGSLRRYRETIGDVDIMGAAYDPEEVINTLVKLPQVVEVLVHGPKKASVLVHKGLQVDLRIVDDDIYGSLIQYFIGSQQHNVLLRERARRQGLSLNEYGITNLDTEEVEKFATEEAFYERLGLQFIPPELREGQHEIERAAEGTIPNLLEVGDIKGDLHSHTTASDGRNSLEDMVTSAKAHGLEYLAITDHSVGRGIANGLNEDRLREQIARIRELNNKLDGMSF